MVGKYRKRRSLSAEVISWMTNFWQKSSLNGTLNIAARSGCVDFN